MFAAIQNRWRAWRRPPITWDGVKTIELKMMVLPASVGHALNELNTEKKKLVRERKRLNVVKSKKRRILRIAGAQRTKRHRP